MRKIPFSPATIGASCEPGPRASQGLGCEYLGSARADSSDPRPSPTHLKTFFFNMSLSLILQTHHLAFPSVFRGITYYICLYVPCGSCRNTRNEKQASKVIALVLFFFCFFLVKLIILYYR